MNKRGAINYGVLPLPLSSYCAGPISNSVLPY